MAVHVAILLRPFLRAILAGDKTVESRLTIRPLPPYRTVRPGDRIHFKASAGPYMATAIAGGVKHYEGLTPARVDALRRKYRAVVGDDEAYWQAKRRARYATFIGLRDVKATGDGPRMPPSNGLAWFTLSGKAARATGARTGVALEPGVVTLTAGALRNRYVPAPQDLRVAHGGTVTLLMPDGQSVRTGLFAGRRQFRWRGWGPYFQAQRLATGDQVRFERVGAGRYRVSFLQGRGDAMARGELKDPSADAGEALNDSAPLERFLSPRELGALLRRALQEDLGPDGLDITSELLIPAAAEARAVFRARQPGRLSGAALLPPLLRRVDRELTLTPRLSDGQALEPGAVIAELAGPLRSVLAVERVALNFLTHLSGIATLTRRYADAVAGTRAQVLDTRKTHAGLRALEKYAVACGGGRNHRMGLFDAVLVKDNHIAHLPLAELAAALSAMVKKARARTPRPTFVEVEVDTPEQLERVLPVGVDIVLLDNMGPTELRRAVALRDRLAPGVKLEASGGVSVETIRSLAESGVDYISAGALTHSAPALDIGLDIAPS